MTKEQLIPYMAGFFDGEGCVCVNRVIRPRAITSYQVCVSVNQKQPGILNLFKAEFGGYLRLSRLNGINRIWTWHLNVNSHKKRFLETLLPFLIGKRAEAELALQFIETARRSGDRYLPECDRNVRERIYQSAKRIKKQNSLIPDVRGQFDLPQRSAPGSLLFRG